MTTKSNDCPMRRTSVRVSNMTLFVDADHARCLNSHYVEVRNTLPKNAKREQEKTKILFIESRVFAYTLTRRKAADRDTARSVAATLRGGQATKRHHVRTVRH